MEKFRISLIDAEHFGLTIGRVNSEEFTDLLERVRAFPERKYLKDHRIWSIPTTQPNVDYLHTFSEDEYSVDPEAALVLRYQTLTDLRGTKKATRRWDYLFNDAVPELAFQPKTSSFKHQTVALDALHDTEFFGLLMEMGTGKTKVVVDECCWQARSRMGNPPYMVLVVAPRTVMNVWVRQFETHGADYWLGKVRTGTRGLDTVLEGVRAVAPLKVFVTSYDRLHAQLEWFSKMKFDLAVLDESTRIKNPNARRTKAALTLRDYCTRRVILTGAPVLNNVMDVWAQFEFLAPGSLGYASYYAFRNRYAQVRKVGNMLKVSGSRRVDELKERMAKHSFVVTKDRCLDLPPKTYELREVEMTAEQRRVYDEMLEFFIASLAEQQHVAKHAITQLLRLAQICSGFLGDQVFSDTKVQELLEIDVPKLLVWCRFRKDIERCVAALKADGRTVGELHGGVPDKERDRVVDAFNSNGLDVLVGQPGAGGLGLTLLGSTENPCHTVVYYSNDFNLEYRVQSEDRCHRIGQHRPVHYIDLVCEDSVDYRIAKALQDKRDLSDAVKDMASIRALLLGE